MAQVQGHSIDEQWDLSMQFEGLVELALHQTVETYIALATGKVLTADASFDSTTPSVYTIWQKQVDTSLGPFVYATFESAALNVAHGVANVADLPLGHGVPLISDDFTAGYVAQVKNQMVNVSDDLWSTINQELQKGVAANEGIEELSNRIRTAGAMTTARANATARTTVVQASNAGSLSQARLLGDDNVTKEWLATEDERTRPAHAHADQQRQPLSKPFEVGGFFLMYPGDPSGPAGEVINCRCTLVYNFAETTTVLHTCECSNAQTILAAVVPASSCVCPITASLAPSGYVSPVSSYAKAVKEDIYTKFQSPSKISPAYGGAKIHKQLEPIKNALHLTDADAEALLKAIDEQYALAGGKSSFAEKYEEWLNSPAGKKVVKVPLSAPSPLSPGFTMPTPASLGVAPVSAPTSFVARGLSVVPQPDVADLKFMKAAGGTHGAAFYEDVKTGEKWIFKPVPYGKEYVAKLEQVTAKLQSMSGLKQPSVYAVRMNGKYGSLQSMHDAVDAWPKKSDFKPLKLSDDDILELQREQIFDWFTGNRDAHSGNFLRLSNGHIVGIDKGAGFKTLNEKFPNWKVKYDVLPSTTLVYRDLWQAYADGKNVKLFDPSTGALHDLIKQISAIPDDDLRRMLTPFAQVALKEGKLPFNDIDKFMDAVIKRKNNLEADFAKMYDKAVAERAKSLSVSVPSVPTPSTPTLVTPPPIAAPVSTAAADLVDQLEPNLLPKQKNKLVNAFYEMDYSLSHGVTFEDAWGGAHIADVKKIPGLKTLSDDELIGFMKAYAQKNSFTSDLTKWPDTLGGAVSTPGVATGGVDFGTFESGLDAADKTNIVYTLQNIDDFMTNSGLTFDQAWSFEKFTIDNISGLKGLAQDEQAALLKAYLEKHHPTADLSKWPGATSTPAIVPTAPDFVTFETGLDAVSKTNLHTLIDDVDYRLEKGESFANAWNAQKSLIDTVPSLKPLTLDDQISLVKEYTAKNHPSYDLTKWPTTPPPSVVPTIVTPATATAPAAVDLLDISTVSDVHIKELAAKFKSIKPVTPNWGGSAVVKTLQETKKALGSEFAKYNDGQLLKMLDQATGAAGKTGKTFFGEAESWLKTPAGKKYATDAGLPGLLTPSAVAAPATTATATVTTTTGVTTSIPASLGDISGIDVATQQTIHSTFKAHGVYLSGPPSHIWDTLQKLKKTNPSFTGYSDLQLVRVVDEISAKKLGVANAHLYEDKLVNWMKTKSGHDHMAGKPLLAAKKAAKKFAKKSSYTPSSYSAPTTPATKMTVDVDPIPRNISATDNSFPVVSNSQAQTLQNSYTPWAPAQSTSLRHYTSNAGYTNMNKLLRDQIGTPSTLKHVKDAQAAMRPSTRPMILHRGTGTKQFGFKDNAPLADVEALVGKTLEDKGFMSTSVGGSAAFGGSPVLIEFEAPTGTQMAYVKSISHYSTEDEMLLAAGTRYKVLSVSKPGHQIIVRVRIVP